MAKLSLKSFVGSMMCVATLTLASAPASAKVIYVDAARGGAGEDGTYDHPYNSIQEGIDLAVAGDTVTVAPGTYSEASHLTSRCYGQMTTLLELKSDVTVEAPCGATIAVPSLQGLSAAVIGCYSGAPGTPDYAPIQGVVFRGFAIDIDNLAAIPNPSWPEILLVNSAASSVPKPQRVNTLQGLTLGHPEYTNNSGKAVFAYYAPTVVKGNTIANMNVGIEAGGIRAAMPIYELSDNTISNTSFGLLIGGYYAYPSFLVTGNVIHDLAPGGTCIQAQYYVSAGIDGNSCEGGSFGVKATITYGGWLTGNTFSYADEFGIKGWCVCPESLNTFVGCAQNQDCICP